MGIIKQGILGGFLGKVGGVVGGNFKGIATMRAMPLSVANPRTAAQVLNRTRFSQVTGLATAIGTDLLRLYWNRFAVKMSGFNMFCQVNKDVFNSNGAFMQNTLLVSDGSIPAPDLSLLNANPTTQIVTGAFSYDIVGERLASDVCNILVINTSGDIVAVSQDTDVSLGAFSITCPPGMLVQGEVVFVYAVSRRADGTKVSNTNMKHVVASGL